ncbi:DUF2007 domain-containing protein [Vibrio gallicus]|uniref:DUF2007 domain-containing protein n=1 Tax=Vibrio gallicus TaxID=190897 RepID=UPI0021C41B47|nr:DUF2007 domain-containing protein [Vibrio gallicus]
MKIFIASNPPEAHFISELLIAEGVAVEVRGEGLFGLQGELPFDESTQPYVWLSDPSLLDKAQAVIQAYSQQGNYQDWTCPHCSEVNEGQFALCWQCSNSNPDQATD